MGEILAALDGMMFAGCSRFTRRKQHMIRELSMIDKATWHQPNYR